MIRAKRIELLAPAKNCEYGMEAIEHGADAVYIGAPKFSARAAAGNTVEEIRTLVVHAHTFGARVYAALNTILKDEELKEAEQVIWDLFHAGCDALIIQDPGLLQLDLPPIALHASTQMDNRTLEKIRFWEACGFSQAVLARELSLEEIKHIASDTSLSLEAFVHGALCVSYSGQCYLSESVTKRSANRGVCAQLCRLPYTLIDSDNKILIRNKYLLSMKDLNLSSHLEELLDAGVSSLKIEGRLKDLTYLKNTVAYYRQQLDKLFLRRPEYVRSSSGSVDYAFIPSVDKSFNRGYTRYFLLGESSSGQFSDSSKSMGEAIGTVKSVFDRFFVLSGSKKLHNGDGLCYLNDKNEPEGIHVNRVEGEKIFPAEPFVLRKGMHLYRNFDHEFEKRMNKKSASRKINITSVLEESPDGFVFSVEDEDGITVSVQLPCKKEPALKDQTENIRNNLCKTGNTVFNVAGIEIRFSQNWFIPASSLSDLRRRATEKLLACRLEVFNAKSVERKKTDEMFPVKTLTYRGNVMNKNSRRFYEQHGSLVAEPAYEKKRPWEAAVMFTRYCLKQVIGSCPKENDFRMQYKEPLYLLHRSTRLRLEFDCKQCEMRIYPADSDKT